MKERPILFADPMVRAILNGQKTQTRRIYKTKNGGLGPHKNDLPGMRQIFRECPYGQVGDRLWVREAHWYFKDKHDPVTGYFPPKMTVEDVDFRADDRSTQHEWYPSIFMPRWASRITLEVTDVRVERLQDISRGDAMSEGCPFPNMEQGPDPRHWFQDLWHSLNGPGTWALNPWVWVISFKAITP